MSKLPEALRIGYADWVIEERGPSDMGMPGALGGCLYDMKQLRVVEGLKGQEKVETVLHEVLHAVRQMGGLDLEGDGVEEAQVAGMTRGLLQVIRDNPELFEWIIEEFEGGL